MEFDVSSGRYWTSRLKAMAWAAAYSAQFESGPISEASIGNVGKQSPTMAGVDLVVPPVGGFPWMMIEDYVDQRFISHWEHGTSVNKVRFLPGCPQSRQLNSESTPLQAPLIPRQPTTGLVALSFIRDSPQRRWDRYISPTGRLRGYRAFFHGRAYHPAYWPRSVPACSRMSRNGIRNF